MSNPLFDRLFGRLEGAETIFLTLADGQTITHDTFLRLSARIANAIAAKGVGIGDRVAVQIDKSVEALAVYAACVRAGFVFLPLNTAYTSSEVTYFVENSGARLVICDPGKADALAPVAAGAEAELLTLGGNGDGTLMALADQASEKALVAERDIDDLAAFLYTSGTTGRSKGAMLTQGNLLSNAETLVDYWRFSKDDVLLHALPIFHTHGLFVATNVMLLAGGSMLFLPKFDTDAVLALLPKATTMMGVPTFYTRLLDDSRLTGELVRHMRLFISGSAPLLAETHQSFTERTGHAILERYGMTETNMNTSNPYNGERRAGTVGFPLPGVELKITDPDTGAELPQGEIGMIEVKGPNVFKGYWQMPEKTRQELRGDGFFITGDLGTVSSDGYVSIVGRGKDLIISGGYNIYPKEIELLLDDQPGVKESAVIGVPHPDFGESVVAVVVPQSENSVDPDVCLASIAPKLARFKQPRKIVLVEELPRNTMGKVQKIQLREIFEDALKT